MSSPRLLLLDEPWVGLAPPAVELVRRVVEGLVADGAGVLVAQPQGHLALGARPLSLDGGRLVAAAEV
jgi:ABC-type branched-subunit amino acid transport system ATPase component